MGLTILNAHVQKTPQIEQIVNTTIGLAMEQGLTPETQVDVDNPLTLGTVELTGLSAESHPEVDMTAQIKPDEPSP